MTERWVNRFIYFPPDLSEGDREALEKEVQARIWKFFNPAGFTTVGGDPGRFQIPPPTHDMGKALYFAQERGYIPAWQR